MKIKEFNSTEDAASYLTFAISQELKEQIYSWGRATWILPGGRSIKPFFSYFAQLTLPWEKIIIGLSDERCVPIKHEMSNERQLKESFLSNLKNYNYLPLTGELISAIKSYPPVTVLSMGADGHVASLFPAEARDWKKQNIGIYVTKTQSPNRVSLTEQTLLLSQKIYIIVAGKEKIKFLEKLDISSSTLEEIYEKSEIIRCLND